MRIAVAMSGGVDSSTAAAILSEAGHEVVGLTLKVWESSRCCSIADAEDARRAAHRIGIPFFVLDAREAFETEVMGPFVRGYGSGATPNPCVACNRRVKFRWLLERSRALGCDALATGHYARLEGEPGDRRLRAGVDKGKDQSYFLVPESASDLDTLAFPLGDLTKAEVRKIAADRGLAVAAKPESQDVCFVPRGGLGEFLAAALGEPAPGDVVDAGGGLLGRHRGLHAYTVGQRRGIGIPGREPLYVIRKDVAGNRLVVGPREALLAGRLVGSGAVWLPGAPAERSFPCSVKIRSTAPAVDCRVERSADRVDVTFSEPQFGVAPGQLAVFYQDDLVLGGARIEEGRDA